MEKNKLKDNTTNESHLQRIYNYAINPKDSKIFSDRGFVNIDNGQMGVVIGVRFTLKITNQFTLTHSVVNQTNFFSNNYLNQ